MPGTLHEQAVDILHRLISGAMGAELMADSRCNECFDRHHLDLVEGAAKVERGPRIASVIPDLGVCLRISFQRRIVSCSGQILA